MSWRPFDEDEDAEGRDDAFPAGADGNGNGNGAVPPEWPELDAFDPELNLGPAPSGFELDDDPGSGRWPLDPRGLYPRERWVWFEQLWSDACMLRERYRLALRAGWWEDEVQLEALAALAAWVQRYDSGEWDDPPG